ncbi:hypothetical protein OOK31_10290 [Streptomyces sp. NBC_00249]|uniref:hypothetical protein n=1 Tax=Streptomyces sp. NBC_00249 TaxID=2975690 RepID=UPI00225A1C60|nr:hypothetical protein [Streptomyces sp. NBC_00249]MCX5194280.1 hypothetical protein [Streptomyces sp. NBC_00249]
MPRRSAAAAALLAASLTLTACSSSGDGKASAGAGATPKPPAASPVPDPADASPTLAAPAAPDAKPTGPVLPDAKLTPKTGTFKENEKQYLSGRVPEKTDPAAVLQTGQETCQRVARTAKRDKDAAVGAVISGEITGAKDAITFLCPEQKPVLAAAEQGFGDSPRTTPAPGTYRALTQSTTCTWEAKSKDGSVLASGPETPPKPGAPTTATVPQGTTDFHSTGCYAWLPA